MQRPEIITRDVGLEEEEEEEEKEKEKEKEKKKKKKKKNMMTKIRKSRV